MKKGLIISYFIGMFLLTYLAAKAVAVYKSGPVEIVFREHEERLSDTEIAQQGIVPKEDKRVVMKSKTKETRTKTLFGWETEVVTVEQPSTWYVDNRN